MRYVITESQYKLIMEDGLEVEPSKTAIKNICDSKKFCSAQGKITFGQLRYLVNAAKKERLFKGIGEGSFKAMIRLIPLFLPQVAIAGFIGSTLRALNKILRPTITETDTYKTWWGKAIMKSFDLVEGELPIDDPLSKIFFISDGLMTMMDDKYKLKFANYISNIANSMPDDAEVPEYFVENELRKWINDKFLLEPPLPPKVSSYQDLDLDDQETLQEQKSDRKEVFQELINEKLDYIKKGCDDISHESFPNDISFSSCDVIDDVDSITVDEINMISGSRTDMDGNMYETTPGLYIKITFNISSARTGYGYEDLVYDLKYLIRKSSGGLMVVFDYKTRNTFEH
jgi:hypothetical protein